MSVAKSKINVLEIPSNVNNGDILVLYTPKGKVLYKGIVTQIESLSIQTEQMQTFFQGSWICETSPSSSLENEIITLLNRYRNGMLHGSSFQDTLMVTKYANVIPTHTTNTVGKLESFKEHEVINMTDFIYDIYNKYGIIFDFDIPYGASNGTVNIFNPNYQPLKISDNAECILNITPTTEIEETNKLVIFSKDGVYRATYYATTTNGIVKEPSTNIGRFNVINTKVVYSDDEESVIVNGNLKSVMYNHYLSFEMLLNNKLYNWYDWKLGQPLQIWKDNEYYSTVYTGYELTKESNANPVVVKIECGKVRLTLTKKLLSMIRG